MRLPRLDRTPSLRPEPTSVSAPPGLPLTVIGSSPERLGEETSLPGVDSGTGEDFAAFDAVMSNDLETLIDLDNARAAPAPGARA